MVRQGLPASIAWQRGDDCDCPTVINAAHSKSLLRIPPPSAPAQHTPGKWCMYSRQTGWLEDLRGCPSAGTDCEQRSKALAQRRCVRAAATPGQVHAPASEPGQRRWAGWRRHSAQKHSQTRPLPRPCLPLAFPLLAQLRQGWTLGPGGPRLLVPSFQSRDSCQGPRHTWGTAAWRATATAGAEGLGSGPAAAGACPVPGLVLQANL